MSIVTLAASVMMVCLRLTAPTWSRTVELVALAPFGLPFACLAFVTAIAVVPLTPSHRRWMAWCLAFTALLAAASSYSAVAPLLSGRRPPIEGSGRLVVMTQNLEHGDPEAVAEMALRARADLLVVTEASGPTALQLRATTMQRELPYVVGLSQAGPEGSLIFSRYPLANSVNITDGGESRAVAVSTPQLGEVDLIALHPRPPYEKQGWIADYEQITAYLLDHHAAGSDAARRPAVIAGDLNATLDHAPLRKISAFGFTDAVDQLNLGFRPTWPASGCVRVFGIPVPPLVQIDHVLASTALVATGLTTFHADGTDHLGLLVELQQAKP
jgi:endonuclease/exonuclease/phosphatase (EEP) superfamily protein YafD